MNTNKPAKRSRLQIHLSTCIVLMVLVGLLMLANFSGRIEIEGRDQYGEYGCRSWGFPVAAFQQNVRLVEQSDGSRLPVSIGPVHVGERSADNSGLLRIAANIIAAVFVLHVAALACELLLRRHYARRNERAAEVSGPEAR